MIQGVVRPEATGAAFGIRNIVDGPDDPVTGVMLAVYVDGAVYDGHLKLQRPDFASGADEPGLAVIVVG